MDAIRTYREFLARSPHLVGLRALLSCLYAGTGLREAAIFEFDLVAKDGFSQLPRDIAWFSAMTSLADAAVALQDRERARLVYQQLLPYGDEFFFLSVETSPGGAIAMWLGLLATVTGDYEGAQRWIDRARKKYEALDMPYLLQHLAIAQARLSLALGGANEASKARTLIQGVLVVFADRHEVDWLRQCALHVERKVIPLSYVKNKRLSSA